MNILTIYYDSVKSSLLEKEPFEFKFLNDNIFGVDNSGEEILLKIKDLLIKNVYVYLKCNNQIFLRRTQIIENKFLIKTFFLDPLTPENEELVIKSLCTHYSNNNEHVLGAVLDYKGFSEDYVDWSNVFIEDQYFISYFPELIISRKELFISENSFNKPSKYAFKNGFNIYKK